MELNINVVVNDNGQATADVVASSIQLAVESCNYWDALMRAYVDSTMKVVPVTGTEDSWAEG